MHPERSSTTRVSTSKLFTVCFVGALGGTDVKNSGRTHSLIVLTALDHAAHLIPLSEKIGIRALRSQILAKYLGKRGSFVSFQILPRF